MKANELMVGDWVYNTFSQQAEQVVEIRQDQVILAYNDGNDYDEIEPIPITAEILEKNGFESTPAPSERVWKDNDQEVWLDNEGENYWANIKRDEYYFEGYIEYVHELQHCLKLVGINKEIIL
jgi:hypothetical protein